MTLWIGIIALIVVGVLSVISWKRSPHPKRTALLESLRFLSALAVVLLLWQPEWLTVIHPNTKPQIAILWDDSKSMTTVDAPLPPVLSAKSEVVSRAEWVKSAIASDLWKPLAANGANEVITAPFATPPASGESSSALAGTDLETPLTDILSKQNNLRAVVLLSDGDYNLGQPPVAAAQKLRLRGVPLFPISVGSNVRLPDLDLLSVTAPTYGIVGENVQIPFSIRSSLDRTVRTIVRLRDESGKERTKNIVRPTERRNLRFHSLAFRKGRNFDVGNLHPCGRW
ncbi:MAG: VWA domain-containing protein [Akkermansiaceae bacterium]|nr:VWA domain-containing protein [Akkermansiaceae bacterium]